MGSGSHVEFQSTGARLFASCPGSAVGDPIAAFVKWITPTSFDSFRLGGTLGNLSVLFHSMPTTCAGVPVTQPCASDPEFAPPLFFCNFNGTGGLLSNGPFLATRMKEDVAATGVAAGVHAMMACEMPGYDDVERITALWPGGPQSPTPTMTLEITFMAPLGALDARSIPFVGLPNGNLIRITSLAPPPPSPPPAHPPPLPPPPSPLPSPPPSPSLPPAFVAMSDVLPTSVGGASNPLMLVAKTNGWCMDPIIASDCALPGAECSLRSFPGLSSA